MRTELLPPLPAGRTPRAIGRYVDEPSWISLCPAQGQKHHMTKGGCDEPTQAASDYGEDCDTGGIRHDYRRAGTDADRQPDGVADSPGEVVSPPALDARDARPPIIEPLRAPQGAPNI